MDTLDLAAINSNLQTKSVARKLKIIDQTGSTNQDCLLAASTGAPHGYTVLANSQTQGRGRNRVGQPVKKWESPPGVNIYTSILLRPPFPPGSRPSLTLVAGVAVASTISHFIGQTPKLKWPNDVLWQNGKLAGILVQNIENVAVVGIGLNVNATNKDFTNVGQLAISIQQITGNTQSRNEVAAVLYLQMEKWYNAFIKDPNGVHDQWLELARIIGKKLVYESLDGQKKSIIAEGLDENGFLWGYDSKGEKIVVLSGDMISVDGRKYPCF